MRKKLMVLAMCLGLCTAMLTGCGKPTVESLLDGVMENQPDSQSGEMEFDVVLSVEAQGVSIDVSVEGDFEFEAEGNLMTSNDAAMYMNGDLTLGFFGMEESVPVESYIVYDKDEATTYTYDSDSDTWYYSTVDTSDSDSMFDQDTMDKVSEAMMDAMKESGELAEDTVTVKGVECYVITATLTGNQLADVYKPLDKAFQEVLAEEGLNDYNIKLSSYAKYFNVDITYYISKEDGWIVKSEIDMSDSDITGMLEALMKDAGETEVMDSIGSVSFKKCEFTIIITDQNDTEVEVPRDVKNNAVEGSSAGLVDGIYGDIYGDSSDPYDDDYGYDWGDDDDDWSYGDDDNDTSNSYNTITLNKCDEYNEFLCDVNVPDGFSYDNVFSSPSSGYFYLDCDEGGYITVRNEALWPLYEYLVAGSISTSDLEEMGLSDYTCTVRVIGKALGTDCMLIREIYNDEDYGEIDSYYLAIQYSDGGYTEYLTVDFYNMYDMDDWSDSDFLNLAQEMFGR